MIFAIRRHFGKVNIAKKGPADPGTIKSQKQALLSNKKQKTSTDISGASDGRRTFDFRSQREKIDLQPDQFIKGRFIFNSLGGIEMNAEMEMHVDTIWRDYEVKKAVREKEKIKAYLENRKAALEFLASTSQKLYLLAIRDEWTPSPTSRRPPSLSAPIRLPFS